MSLIRTHPVATRRAGPGYAGRVQEQHGASLRCARRLTAGSGRED